MAHNIRHSTQNNPGVQEEINALGDVATAIARLKERYGF